MNIGDLRRTLGSLADNLDIVLVVPVEDQDGDEVEQLFGLAHVDRRMDPDTGEEYAHFAGGELG